MVIGTAWPVNQQYITKVPVDNVIPSEGVTGWADTWMMTSDAPHPNCMLKWMEYTLGAKVQTEVALYYGATPSNSAACADLDKELADAAAIYHCGDDEFLSAISLWKTPLPDCGDDRGRHVRRLQRLDREVARGPERFLIDAMTTAIEGRATGPRSHVPS